MNKKTYQAPNIVITEVDLSHSLLDGSPNSSKSVGANADGSSITVAGSQEPPKDPKDPTATENVYDSKGFNAWEAWDEY